MGIRVYNTLTRTKEDFVPVVPGKVGIYCCGPTVYSKSHIGHMVGPVIFDTIKRYLTFRGYQVKLVVNITDVDDKIIKRAGEEGIAIDDLTRHVTQDYKENLRRLAVAVDFFPAVSGHMPEIISLIEGLVAKGFAYPLEGDVYFHVLADPDYGKLSNRKLDELLAGVRKEADDRKRHPGDFALWKAAKPGEPKWDSPWGPGRPGWHIECSAMAMKLLGETIDIHGGGLDLCFPHHEDEIAQSESYTGKPLAKYWLHNGLMQYSKETRKMGARAGDFGSQEADKMSKSKGNIVGVSELLTAYSPDLIRFFLLATHYRSPIEFSDDRLAEVGKGFAKLQAVAERSSRILGESFFSMISQPKADSPPPEPVDPTLRQTTGEFRAKFLEWMDDDFNTAGAIGVLFDLATQLNRFADEHKLDQPTVRKAEHVEDFHRAVLVFRELTGILGVLFEPPKKAEIDNVLVPRLIELLLEVRQTARKSKQFAFSDLIRDRLKELGVVIEDRPEGSVWKIEESARTPA